MSEHFEALKNILAKKNPHLTLSIFDSPIRYDDLIRDASNRLKFYNDYFIINLRSTDSPVILDAICLYIPSLTIKIESPEELIEPILIESITSDVKNYLYAKILQQQTWLFQRISENTWHLASGLSHERITQHVVDGALKTIPFSDAVIFRIYDEGQNKLCPVAVSGFKDNYYEYSVSPQESISGKVFESRKPIILNSRDDILASFESYSAIRASVMENNPIANALICVPVLDQQYCYGTLTILSLGRRSVFNSLAVSLLETFASQVALAWRNAKQYDEKVESFNQVNSLRQQLEQQNEMLRSSLNFHNEMIKLSIKNNDISSFIKAMSDKMNLEIGYVDISGAIHGKLRDIDKLWVTLTTNKSNEGIEEAGFIRNELYIQPMMQNQQAVGFVIVNKADASDYIRVTLSRLSDFLIMDIMKKVNNLLIENKRKSSVMDKVLLEGINEDTTTTLSENGFLIQEWIGCIVLSLANTTNRSEDVKLLDMHNKLKYLLARSNAFIYSDEINFMIYLSDNSPERINSSFIKLEKEVVNIGFYQAGVSNVTSAIRIKQSLDQALTTLAVIKKRNKQGVLRFNQTGIERLFVNHEKEEIKQFINDVLSPILDDSEKSQVLLKTLNEYIGNSCSVNNTARSLDIHTNTLYQRIKKIELLTKMDLSSSDDFLIISVACHMLSLSRGVT
ncbi:helix-turn-helix domain-containing protein [Pseudomonas graminis]